jgi:pantetheine-phosphate adenylyltransferase
MIAIYPGTFDPVTKSHIEIIKRASSIFNKLIVAVAIDTTKSALFSIEKRVEMMSEAIFSLDFQPENISVIAFQGLLVEFAEKNKAKVIIRGMRALSDFEYEFKMAYMNKKLNESIETIFLPATEKENFISSSFVREIARLGGDVSGFVQPHVETELKKAFYNGL